MLIEGERLRVQLRLDGTVVERRLWAEEITLLVLHRREAWRKLRAELGGGSRLEVGQLRFEGMS
jgi:hypothetical protein